MVVCVRILQDPNNLLKGNGNEGITVCLLERGHPGLRLGDRHDPSASRCSTCTDHICWMSRLSLSQRYIQQKS